MRVPALTGIRGVAAVAVMLYHIPQQRIFAPYGLLFLSRAYLCVDLFFVLSGFVIAVGYYERVVKHWSAARYVDFLLARTARVFPLHLVVTLVFALRLAANVWGKTEDPLTGTDLAANVLMVQSWGFGTHALAGNSWSVSTELVAYLLFPLIAGWAFLRGAGWLLLAASAAALVYIASTGLGVEGVLDVVERDSVLPIVRCLAGFSLGVLVYRVAPHPLARRLFSGDVAFILICAAIFAAFEVPRSDLLVVALFPPLVLCCWYDGRLARAVMGNRFSFHLGVISYSIYLWHPLFRDVAARLTAIAHKHGHLNLDLGVIIGLIGFSWLWCWLSYLLIETQGHRIVKALGERLERRRVAIDAAE